MDEEKIFEQYNPPHRPYRSSQPAYFKAPTVIVENKNASNKNLRNSRKDSPCSIHTYCHLPLWGLYRQLETQTIRNGKCYGPAEGIWSWEVEGTATQKGGERRRYLATEAGATAYGKYRMRQSCIRNQMQENLVRSRPGKSDWFTDHGQSEFSK